MLIPLQIQKNRQTNINPEIILNQFPNNKIAWCVLVKRNWKQQQQNNKIAAETVSKYEHK